VVQQRTRCHIKKTYNKTAIVVVVDNDGRKGHLWVTAFKLSSSLSSTQQKIKILTADDDDGGQLGVWICGGVSNEQSGVQPLTWFPSPRRCGCPHVFVVLHCWFTFVVIAVVLVIEGRRSSLMSSSSSLMLSSPLLVFGIVLDGHHRWVGCEGDGSVKETNTWSIICSTLLTGRASYHVTINA
jgi:hypothetical protein